MVFKKHGHLDFEKFPDIYNINLLYQNLWHFF